MTRRRRVRTALAALLACGILATPTIPPALADPGDPPGTYHNFVGEDQVDAFSDPTVIRGQDGYWYAYASQTVMRKDNTDGAHVLPMMRSTNLVDWTYIGDVFTAANAPTWWPFEGSLFWAPDIRYLNGTYYLYYSFNRPGKDQAIGLATADSPAGPWTDIGHPVVNINDGTNEIDSALYVGSDGTKYLYYGSFGSGGIKVVQLNDAGTEVASAPRRVVAPSRGEAPYLVERDGWYYLFYSGLGCCDGAQGAYQVFVGRARSPLGPFLDKEGVDLNALHPGGSLVLSTNGNRWVSIGHSANFTDASGQTWMINNALDRTTPQWGGRPTVMDRLDWIDGWPTVNAGLGQSDSAVAAPQLPEVGSTGDTPTPTGFSAAGSGSWTRRSEAQAGGFYAAVSTSPNPQYLLTDRVVAADLRLEADIRLPYGVTPGRQGRAGLTLAWTDRNNHVTAWLDPAAHALVVETVRHGRIVATHQSKVYAGFDPRSWKRLTAEIRGGRATVSVSDADLGNPLATVTVEVGWSPDRRSGVASTRGAGEVDNLSVARLYTPVTEAASDPVVGPLLDAQSDEFAGTALSEAWRWYQNPDGRLEGGAYVWPTQNADFRGSPAMASAMLRDAPKGNYIVETKLTLPITSGPNNSAQAGLIVFASPEHLLRLSPVRTGNSRQVLLWIGLDANPWPEMQGGPSADTMWLRLRHTVHPQTGEHLYRMGSSRDGEHWWWGGTWHLPAGSDPQIGLQSMGGTGLTATFEYFRVYVDATGA